MVSWLTLASALLLMNRPPKDRHDMELESIGQTKPIL